MKPGDWIEFVLLYHCDHIRREEQLWSTTMNKWIPIYGNFLLISNDKEVSFIQNGKLYSINHYDTYLFEKGKGRMSVRIKKINKLKRK